MSSPKLSSIIPNLFKQFPEIHPIPETTKLVTPVFTAGQYSKDDVAKLLGKIDIKDTKAEIRKIKPMEIVYPSPSVESTSKLKKEDGQSNVKQTLSLSSSVTKVRQFYIQHISKTSHMSIDKSGRLWASGSDEYLVHTDLHGNQPQVIGALGSYGCHSVTQGGGLIFSDKFSGVIWKVKKHKTTKLIKLRDWVPFSVHSSHINGDTLVGMVKDREAKVTRYNEAGEELQNIQRDNKGQGLYKNPWYITENINGDVCASDGEKCAVVVVNKSGHHRFSYTGQGSEFWPYGICTDVLGHILVCNSVYAGDCGVYLLDQDGQFLSLLVKTQYPQSVCVDDENNLYVGEDFDSIVSVYKYLCVVV
jgi:hypothetical protein